jgi:3-hydroxymyristoyl/3-hydroxydecanoyl-(acyl carrier protein) dehydratase
MPPLSDGASIDPTVHLSVEQTVRRSLVHKRSLENVLLTEVRACGDDRFLCAGRVPTAHRFFNDAGRTPHRDILFYTELGRQASLAISHASLNVSAEDMFVFEGSQAAVTDAAWKTPCHSAPDLVVVEVRIREMTRRRNDALSRVVADHRMWIGEAQVFQGTGAWTMQPAALFHRLRRMSPTRTAGARSDGSQFAVTHTADRGRPEDAGNVVISRPESIDNGTAYTSSLVVDYRHPYFFDHPCDHIPGMLLLEGCAQVALAAFSESTSIPPGTFGVGAYDVNFAQFVECGVPTALTARVHAAGPDAGGVLASTVQVDISQQNVVAGTATMRMALPISV